MNQTKKNWECWLVCLVFFSPTSYGCECKRHFEKHSLLPSFHPREEIYIFLFLSYMSFLASGLFPKGFQLKKQYVFCANHITNLNFNSIKIVPFTMSTAIQKCKGDLQRFPLLLELTSHSLRKTATTVGYNQMILQDSPTSHDSFRGFSRWFYLCKVIYQALATQLLPTNVYFNGIFF